MSSLIPLLSDFVEKMTNPSYGVNVNEDYSVKFSVTLRDREVGARMLQEMRQLNDPEALSFHGWLWFFGWAKSSEVAVNEELLYKLFKRNSNSFFRAEILALVSESQLRPTEAGITLSEFPDRFIRRILEDVVEPVGNQDTYGEMRILADDVLLVFLQASSQTSIWAASVLLNHRWEGQRRLLNYYRALASGFDVETRAVWAEALAPPNVEG